MAFIAPISTKLVITQQIFVDISCTRLHPNMKKMEKKGKKVKAAIRGRIRHYSLMAYCTLDP
jgi:hypothetical protein